MRLLAATLAAAALSACSDRSNAGLTPMKEGDVMAPNATAARAGLPPIDLALPAKIETATFALG